MYASYSPQSLHRLDRYRVSQNASAQLVPLLALLKLYPSLKMLGINLASSLDFAMVTPLFSTLLAESVENRVYIANRVPKCLCQLPRGICPSPQLRLSLNTTPVDHVR